MPVFELLVLLLPPALAVFSTRLAERQLAGTAAGRHWRRGVAAWLLASSLVFAGWFGYWLRREYATHTVGPYREEGLLEVVAFVVWDSLLVLAANLLAAGVGAVRRLRRPSAAPAVAQSGNSVIEVR